MTALETVLSLALGASLVGAGLPKVLATRAMVDSAQHLGFSVSVYRAIGVVEVAAAAAVLAGLKWNGWGGLAAVGVLLLLSGAITSHLRAGDRFMALLPALTVAALAAAYGSALLLA